MKQVPFLNGKQECWHVFGCLWSLSLAESTGSAFLIPDSLSNLSMSQTLAAGQLGTSPFWPAHLPSLWPTQILHSKCGQAWPISLGEVFGQSRNENNLRTCMPRNSCLKIPYLRLNMQTFSIYITPDCKLEQWKRFVVCFWLLPNHEIGSLWPHLQRESVSTGGLSNALLLLMS